MGSPLLGNSKPKSPLMDLMARAGKAAGAPRDAMAEKVSAPMDAADKEVTIKKVAGGYNVHWDSPGYGPRKTAVASTFAGAMKLAKAYLEGDAESTTEDKTETTEE